MKNDRSENEWLERKQSCVGPPRIKRKQAKNFSCYNFDRKSLVIIWDLALVIKWLDNLKRPSKLSNPF